MDPLLQALWAAIASFITITIIVSLLLYLCKRKPTSKFLPLTHPPTQQPQIHSLSSLSTSFDPTIKQVSMCELVEATSNFDPELIIGDGSFGLVYKAKLLSSGVTVALKKLSPDAFQGLREFRAEMETLGKLRHENLVKILGYCVSGCERVLIYEYVEKGSLDQWLQDTWDEDVVGGMLSWEVRVKIVKGVAKGLEFLHGLDTPIVHRDIKASNVLLDDEFGAHIADFGFARRIEGAHSHVSTQAAGTMGYMPPEYRAGVTAATVKADAYSFGVLMFEVATGRRPNWPVMEEGLEMWMLEWAKKRISENRCLEVVDPCIPREGLKGCEVAEFLRVADMCTSDKPKDRPPMREVVEMLDRLGA